MEGFISCAVQITNIVLSEGSQFSYLFVLIYNRFIAKLQNTIFNCEFLGKKVTVLPDPPLKKCSNSPTLNFLLRIKLDIKRDYRKTPLKFLSIHK